MLSNTQSKMSCLPSLLLMRESASVNNLTGKFSSGIVQLKLEVKTEVMLLRSNDISQLNMNCNLFISQLKSGKDNLRGECKPSWSKARSRYQKNKT